MRAARRTILSGKRLGLVELLCCGVLALAGCGVDEGDEASGGDLGVEASDVSALINNTAYVMAVRDDLNCLNSTPKPAKCDGSASQSFSVFDQGGGVWVIRNNNTANKCLAYDPNLNAGKVYLETCNGALPRQRWQFFSQFSGAELYLLRSQTGTNMCLDAARSGLIRACDANRMTQHWQFLRYPHTNLSVHPRINSDCARFITSTGTYPEPIIYNSVWVDAARMATNPDCVSNGKIQAAQWWGSSESQGNYIPGGALPYDPNTYRFALTPNGDGTYTAAYTFDNQFHDNGRRDQYNFVSFTDSYDQSALHVPLPVPDDKYWVEFKIRITAHSRDGLNPNLNKARIALFVMTTNKARTYQREYEYVLFRDAEYDGCTSSSTWWGPNLYTPCETGSLFDRRAGGGAGEYVYVSPGKLHQVIPGIQAQPTLNANSTWVSYRIPFSRFMSKHGWKVPISPTEGARIAGVGIGIETLGKAKTSVEVKDLRTFSTP